MNFPVFELLFVIPSCSCVFDWIIFQMPVIDIFCFFNIWNNFGILVDLYDIIAILTKLILFSSSAAVFEFWIFLGFCYRFLFFLVKCYGKWNRYNYWIVKSIHFLISSVYLFKCIWLVQFLRFSISLTYTSV